MKAEIQEMEARARAAIAWLKNQLEAALARQAELEARVSKQLADLTAIREMADHATGIDRANGDPREPGALGAVKVLVERFRDMENKDADR
jgi:hypothetical protein